MLRKTKHVAPHLRCPLCHTDLDCGEEVYRCGDCDTPYHDVCARELHGCATLGCASLERGHRFELSRERKAQIRFELGRELRDRVQRSHDFQECDVAGCRQKDPWGAVNRAVNRVANPVARALGLSVLCDYHGGALPLVLGLGLFCLATALALPSLTPMPNPFGLQGQLFLAVCGGYFVYAWAYFTSKLRAAREPIEPIRPKAPESSRERVPAFKPAKPSDLPRLS